MSAHHKHTVSPMKTTEDLDKLTTDRRDSKLCGIVVAKTYDLAGCLQGALWKILKELHLGVGKTRHKGG